MPAHYQRGKSGKVAIVFSCPGRHEEAALLPAAKVTGRNLAALLDILASKLCRADYAREYVTVANAWSCVEYEAKTGRSQATDAEILAPENIKRLEGELAHITELVIFCGDKAKLAADALRLAREPQRLFVCHLGTRGLGAITVDTDGVPILVATAKSWREKRRIQRANTNRRLSVVAQELIAQMKSP